MAKLTSEQILAVINAGGSVTMPTGQIIWRAADVPTQAALDAGTYDAYSDQANQSALLASRTARPNTRRMALVQANGGSSFTAIGDAVAILGTGGNVAPTAAVPWLNTSLTSGAVSGNQGGVGSGFGNFWFPGKLLFQSYFVTGASIAVQRIWLGVASTSWAAMLGTDTPAASALSGACFRYSTAIGDTTWKCVTFDGVAQTVSDSGVTVAVSVGKKFEITDDGTSTVFRIDGVVVATNTANRPGNVAVRQGAGVQTLEAVAKSVSVGWLYTETD
jgi:hypothetical protein